MAGWGETVLKFAVTLQAAQLFQGFKKIGTSIEYVDKKGTVLASHLEKNFKGLNATISKTDGSVDKLAASLKKGGAATAALAKDVDQLGAQYKQGQAHVEKLQANVRQLMSTVDMSTKQNKIWGQSIESSVKGVSSQLDRVRTQYERLHAATQREIAAEEKLAALRKKERVAVDALGRSSSRTAGGRYRAVPQSVINAERMLERATRARISSQDKAIRQTKEFDYAMDRAGASVQRYADRMRTATYHSDRFRYNMTNAFARANAGANTLISYMGTILMYGQQAATVFADWGMQVTKMMGVSGWSSEQASTNMGVAKLLGIDPNVFRTAIRYSEKNVSTMLSNFEKNKRKQDYANAKAEERAIMSRFSAKQSLEKSNMMLEMKQMQMERQDISRYWTMRRLGTSQRVAQEKMGLSMEQVAFAERNIKGFTQKVTGGAKDYDTYVNAQLAQNNKLRTLAEQKRQLLAKNSIQQVQMQEQLDATTAKLAQQAAQGDLSWQQAVRRAQMSAEKDAAKQASAARLAALAKEQQKYNYSPDVMALLDLGIIDRSMTKDTLPKPQEIINKLIEIIPTLEPAKRMKVMQKFFGRGAEGMIRYFMVGKDERERLAKEVGEAGLVLRKNDMKSWKQYYETLRIMQLRWQGIQIAVMRSLVPILAKAMNSLKPLMTFFQKHADWIVKATGALMAYVAVVKTLAVVGAGFNIGKGIMSFLSPGLVSSASTKWKSLGGLIGSIGAMFTNPVTGIVAAVAAVGIGGYVAYKKWTPFHNAVDGILRKIGLMKKESREVMKGVSFAKVGEGTLEDLKKVVDIGALGRKMSFKYGVEFVGNDKYVRLLNTIADPEMRAKWENLVHEIKAKYNISVGDPDRFITAASGTPLFKQLQRFVKKQMHYEVIIDGDKRVLLTAREMMRKQGKILVDIEDTSNLKYFMNVLKEANAFTAEQRKQRQALLAAVEGSKSLQSLKPQTPQERLEQKLFPTKYERTGEYKVVGKTTVPVTKAVPTLDTGALSGLGRAIKFVLDGGDINQLNGNQKMMLDAWFTWAAKDRKAASAWLAQAFQPDWAKAAARGIAYSSQSDILSGKARERLTNGPLASGRGGISTTAEDIRKAFERADKKGTEWGDNMVRQGDRAITKIDEVTTAVGRLYRALEKVTGTNIPIDEILSGSYLAPGKEPKNSKRPRNVPLASGGYVTSPTPALIGERGPEFVFNREQMAGLREMFGGLPRRNESIKGAVKDAVKELLFSSGPGVGGMYGGAASMNRTTFATAILSRLGIPANNTNVGAFVNWEAMEGGGWNWAKHNPLNTTMPMAGYKQGGSQGNIGIYNSWEQGIAATIATLQNGLYNNILAALASGTASDIYQAIDSSPWGTHSLLSTFGNPSELSVAKGATPSTSKARSNIMKKITMQLKRGTTRRLVLGGDTDTSMTAAEQAIANSARLIGRILGTAKPDSEPAPKAMAGGGYAKSPTRALIGERGPEFVFNRDQMQGLREMFGTVPRSMHVDLQGAGKELASSFMDIVRNQGFGASAIAYNNHAWTQDRPYIHRVQSTPGGSHRDHVHVQWGQNPGGPTVLKAGRIPGTGGLTPAQQYWMMQDKNDQFAMSPSNNPYPEDNFAPIGAQSAFLQWKSQNPGWKEAYYQQIAMQQSQGIYSNVALGGPLAAMGGSIPYFNPQNEVPPEVFFQRYGSTTRNVGSKRQKYGGGVAYYRTSNGQTGSVDELLYSTGPGTGALATGSGLGGGRYLPPTTSYGSRGGTYIPFFNPYGGAPSFAAYQYGYQLPSYGPISQPARPIYVPPQVQRTPGVRRRHGKTAGQQGGMDNVVTRAIGAGLSGIGRAAKFAYADPKYGFLGLLGEIQEGIGWSVYGAGKLTGDKASEAWLRGDPEARHRVTGVLPEGHYMKNSLVQGFFDVAADPTMWIGLGEGAKMVQAGKAASTFGTVGSEVLGATLRRPGVARDLMMPDIFGGKVFNARAPFQSSRAARKYAALGVEKAGWNVSFQAGLSDRQKLKYAKLLAQQGYWTQASQLLGDVQRNVHISEGPSTFARRAGFGGTTYRQMARAEGALDYTAFNEGTRRTIINVSGGIAGRYGKKNQGARAIAALAHETKHYWDATSTDDAIRGRYGWDEGWREGRAESFEEEFMRANYGDRWSRATGTRGTFSERHPELALAPQTRQDMLPGMGAVVSHDPLARSGPRRKVIPNAAFEGLEQTSPLAQWLLIQKYGLIGEPVRTSELQNQLVQLGYGPYSGIDARGARYMSSTGTSANQTMINGIKKMNKAAGLAPQTRRNFSERFPHFVDPAQRPTAEELNPFEQSAWRNLGDATTPWHSYGVRGAQWGVGSEGRGYFSHIRKPNYVGPDFYLGETTTSPLTRKGIAYGPKPTFSQRFGAIAQRQMQRAFGRRPGENLWDRSYSDRFGLAPQTRGDSRIFSMSDEEIKAAWGAQWPKGDPRWMTAPLDQFPPLNPHQKAFEAAVRSGMSIPEAQAYASKFNLAPQTRSHPREAFQQGDWRSRVFGMGLQPMLNEPGPALTVRPWNFKEWRYRNQPAYDADKLVKPGMSHPYTPKVLDSYYGQYLQARKHLIRKVSSIHEGGRAEGLQFRSTGLKQALEMEEAKSWAAWAWGLTPEQVMEMQGVRRYMVPTELYSKWDSEIRDGSMFLPDMMLGSWKKGDMIGTQHGSEKPVMSLMDRMLAGKDVITPYIVVDGRGKVMAQEGRHRNFAASLLGIENIPVDIRTIGLDWADDEDFLKRQLGIEPWHEQVPIAPQRRAKPSGKKAKVGGGQGKAGKYRIKTPPPARKFGTPTVPEHLRRYDPISGKQIWEFDERAYGMPPGLGFPQGSRYQIPQWAVHIYEQAAKRKMVVPKAIDLSMGRLLRSEFHGVPEASYNNLSLVHLGYGKEDEGFTIVLGRGKTHDGKFAPVTMYPWDTAKRLNIKKNIDRFEHPEDYESWQQRLGDKADADLLLAALGKKLAPQTRRAKGGLFDFMRSKWVPGKGMAGGTRRWISPNKYLDAEWMAHGGAAAGRAHSDTVFRRKGGVSRVERMFNKDYGDGTLASRLYEGKPLDVSELGWSSARADDVEWQEGRHRAFLARWMGLDRIPVDLRVGGLRGEELERALDEMGYFDMGEPGIVSRLKQPLLHAKYAWLGDYVGSANFEQAVTGRLTKPLRSALGTIGRQYRYGRSVLRVKGGKPFRALRDKYTRTMWGRDYNTQKEAAQLGMLHPYEMSRGQHRVNIIDNELEGRLPKATLMEIIDDVHKVSALTAYREGNLPLGNKLTYLPDIMKIRAGRAFDRRLGYSSPFMSGMRKAGITAYREEDVGPFTWMTNQRGANQRNAGLQSLYKDISHRDIVLARWRAQGLRGNSGGNAGTMGVPLPLTNILRHPSTIYERFWDKMADWGVTTQRMTGTREGRSDIYADEPHLLSPQNYVDDLLDSRGDPIAWRSHRSLTVAAMKARNMQNWGRRRGMSGGPISRIPLTNKLRYPVGWAKNSWLGVRAADAMERLRPERPWEWVTKDLLEGKTGSVGDIPFLHKQLVRFEHGSGFDKPRPVAFSTLNDFWNVLYPGRRKPLGVTLGGMAQGPVRAMQRGYSRLKGIPGNIRGLITPYQTNISLGNWHNLDYNQFWNEAMPYNMAELEDMGVPAEGLSKIVSSRVGNRMTPESAHIQSILTQISRTGGDWMPHRNVMSQYSGLGVEWNMSRKDKILGLLGRGLTRAVRSPLARGIGRAQYRTGRAIGGAYGAARSLFSRVPRVGVSDGPTNVIRDYSDLWSPGQPLPSIEDMTARLDPRLRQSFSDWQGGSTVHNTLLNAVYAKNPQKTLEFLRQRYPGLWAPGQGGRWAEITETDLVSLRTEMEDFRRSVITPYLRQQEGDTVHLYRAHDYHPNAALAGTGQFDRDRAWWRRPLLGWSSQRYTSGGFHHRGREEWAMVEKDVPVEDVVMIDKNWEHEHWVRNSHAWYGDEKLRRNINLSKMFGPIARGARRIGGAVRGALTAPSLRPATNVPSGTDSLVSLHHDGGPSSFFTTNQNVDNVNLPFETRPFQSMEDAFGAETPRGIVELQYALAQRMGVTDRSFRSAYGDRLGLLEKTWVPTKNFLDLQHEAYGGENAWRVFGDEPEHRVARLKSSRDSMKRPPTDSPYVVIDESGNIIEKGGRHRAYNAWMYGQDQMPLQVLSPSLEAREAFFARVGGETSAPNFGILGSLARLPKYLRRGVFGNNVGSVRERAMSYLFGNQPKTSRSFRRGVMALREHESYDAASDSIRMYRGAGTSRIPQVKPRLGASWTTEKGVAQAWSEGSSFHEEMIPLRNIIASGPASMNAQSEAWVDFGRKRGLLPSLFDRADYAIAKRRGRLLGAAENTGGTLYGGFTHPLRELDRSFPAVQKRDRYMPFEDDRWVKVWNEADADEVIANNRNSYSNVLDWYKVPTGDGGWEVRYLEKIPSYSSGWPTLLDAQNYIKHNVQHGIRNTGYGIMPPSGLFPSSYSLKPGGGFNVHTGTETTDLKVPGSAGLQGMMRLAASRVYDIISPDRAAHATGALDVNGILGMGPEKKRLYDYVEEESDDWIDDIVKDLDLPSLDDILETPSMAALKPRTQTTYSPFLHWAITPDDVNPSFSTYEDALMKADQLIQDVTPMHETLPGESPLWWPMQLGKRKYGIQGMKGSGEWFTTLEEAYAFMAKNEENALGMGPVSGAPHGEPKAWGIKISGPDILGGEDLGGIWGGRLAPQTRRRGRFARPKWLSTIDPAELSAYSQNGGDLGALTRNMYRWPEGHKYAGNIADNPLLNNVLRASGGTGSARMIQVDPLRYLDIQHLAWGGVARGGGGGRKDWKGAFAQNPGAYLGRMSGQKNQLINGLPMEPPYMTFGEIGGNPGMQGGRHRSVDTLQLGLDRMPLVVMNERGVADDEFLRGLEEAYGMKDLTDAKPQSMLNWLYRRAKYGWFSREVGGGMGPGSAYSRAMGRYRGSRFGTETGMDLAPQTRAARGLKPDFGAMGVGAGLAGGLMGAGYGLYRFGKWGNNYKASKEKRDKEYAFWNSTWENKNSGMDVGEYMYWPAAGARIPGDRTRFHIGNYEDVFMSPERIEWEKEGAYAGPFGWDAEKFTNRERMKLYMKHYGTMGFPREWGPAIMGSHYMPAWDALHKGEQSSLNTQTASLLSPMAPFAGGALDALNYWQSINKMKQRKQMKDLHSRRRHPWNVTPVGVPDIYDPMPQPRRWYENAPQTAGVGGDIWGAIKGVGGGVADAWGWLRKNMKTSVNPYDEPKNDKWHYKYNIGPGWEYFSGGDAFSHHTEGLNLKNGPFYVPSDPFEDDWHHAPVNMSPETIRLYSNPKWDFPAGPFGRDAAKYTNAQRFAWWTTAHQPFKFRDSDFFASDKKPIGWWELPGMMDLWKATNPRTPTDPYAQYAPRYMRNPNWSQSVSLGAYAGGGVITKPTLALMGEGGRRETIFNDAQMKELGKWMSNGGGKVEVHVHMSGIMAENEAAIMHIARKAGDEVGREADLRLRNGMSGYSSSIS